MRIPKLILVLLALIAAIAQAQTGYNRFFMQKGSRQTMFNAVAIAGNKLIVTGNTIEHTAYNPAQVIAFQFDKATGDSLYSVYFEYDTTCEKYSGANGHLELRNSNGAFFMTGYKIENIVPVDSYRHGYSFFVNMDTQLQFSARKYWLWQRKFDNFRAIDATMASDGCKYIVGYRGYYRQNPDTSIDHAMIQKIDSNNEVMWSKYFAIGDSSQSFITLGNVLPKGDSRYVAIGVLQCRNCMYNTIVQRPFWAYNFMVEFDTAGTIYRIKIDSTESKSIMKSNTLRRTKQGGYVYGSHRMVCLTPDCIVPDLDHGSPIGVLNFMDSNFNPIKRITLDTGYTSYIPVNPISLKDGSFILLSSVYLDSCMQPVVYADSTAFKRSAAKITKLSAEGDVIWVRYYRDAANWVGQCPGCMLNPSYDFLHATEDTTNGDLYVVGAATLRINNTGFFNQMGWLLRLDSNGLVFPGYDTVNFCPQTTPTGIEPVTQHPTIAIYPNPASEVLQYHLSLPTGSSNATLTIYSILGEKIYSEMITAPTAHGQIDTNAWANGIYTYSLSSDSGTSQSGKLIIQHP